MDESTLIELTKCFYMLTKCHDGTFLKFWSEGGTIRFHLSNNNVRRTNFQHSSFRQPTFSQQSTSTPNQKLGERVEDKRVLNGEKNEDKDHPLNDVDEQSDQKQPDEKNEDREPKDHPLNGEQPDGKQTENESDKSLAIVNQYGYPDKGRFERAIFSYCSGEQGTQFIGRSISYVQCCSLCRIHADNSLKYVCFCDEHRGSGWHEWSTECHKIEPGYDHYHYTGKKIGKFYVKT